jgi:hypothetical protein
MSWFPNYLPLPEPELSDAALLAVGKALHVANNFEMNCRHVLEVADAVSYIQDHEGTSALDAFHAIIKARFLDGTIKRLGQLSDITEKDVSLLERAKEARNFIAHEGAIFFSSGKWLIIAQLKALRTEVRHLAHGANLVSLWSYEIENRKSGPRGIFDEYPEMVDRWVFGHVADIVDILSQHAEVQRAEAVLLEWQKFLNRRKGGKRRMG